MPSGSGEEKVVHSEIVASGFLIRGRMTNTWSCQQMEKELDVPVKLPAVASLRCSTSRWSSIPAFRSMKAKHRRLVMKSEAV